MASDRSFYGGDAVQGADNISGGVYTGPGLPGAGGPWKCPACTIENTGDLADGCVHCGSGSAKARHIGHAPGVTPLPRTQESPAFTAVKADMENAMSIYAFAHQWAAAHPGASLEEAFMAGWSLATQKTMAAPPVAVDVPSLAPEGKPRRTILAALRLFRTQVLPEADEEIASGEWCSIEETEDVIRQLEAEEDGR